MVLHTLAEPPFGVMRTTLLPSVATETLSSGSTPNPMVGPRSQAIHRAGPGHGKGASWARAGMNRAAAGTNPP